MKHLKSYNLFESKEIIIRHPINNKYIGDMTNQDYLYDLKDIAAELEDIGRTTDPDSGNYDVQVKYDIVKNRIGDDRSFQCIVVRIRRKGKLTKFSIALTHKELKECLYRMKDFMVEQGFDYDYVLEELPKWAERNLPQNTPASELHSHIKEREVVSDIDQHRFEFISGIKIRFFPKREKR